MPSLVVVAGPNGSGKSTTAPTLLRDTLKVDEFVNADAIAAGLSAFSPDRVAFPAGRIIRGRPKACRLANDRWPGSDREERALEPAP